ncbi:helix-turn-helix domain-containing protein [Neobacillus drentensis]|uniref:helix-turn-helix domain-containing protein n=1 Tax=Neobacillus drentensis TaxID=220684 RepID=UPI002FFF9F1E
MEHELLWIYEEEKKMKAKLREAKDRRDREAVEFAQKALITLYVRFGEHFKMNAEPDPIVAERYLKAAVILQKDHPVANYRLAHLLYRKKMYTDALFHFERALAGSDSEGLNESQEMIANMFMANCGIFIARQALTELEASNENPYIDFDEKLVGRYRGEMLEAIGEMFDNRFYRKIADEKEEFISDEKVQLILENNWDAKQVVLCSMDDGVHLYFGKHQPISLEPTAFRILYFTLKAGGRPLTGEDIEDRFFEGLGQEIDPDLLRQTINRMQRRIPFWDKIIETVHVRNPDTNRDRRARKLAEGIGFCMICRAGDILPEEG